MVEEYERQNNLVDTTDCLEAIGVFKSWKNGLFVILLLSLLLLQGSFWVVNLGYVEAGGNEAETEVVSATADETVSKVQEAAKQVAAEPNEATETAVVEKPTEKKTARFSLKADHLVLVIRFLNFLVIPVAILYCLTMLFSLKVSLLGRLGGINHISRAFFLSLLAVVLLLPWQVLFNGVVKGVLFTPQELISKHAAVSDSDLFGTALYYLRFVVYWSFEVLLFILAQIRGARWAKAILARLEVV